MSAGARRMTAWALLAAVATVATPAPEGLAATARTLLVHLPSAPVEAANRQAEAIDAFAGYLASRLPEAGLAPKIFRRFSDAEGFLEEHSEDVALMLSDASFALRASAGLTPAYRFQHDGRSSYRRLLVVRADRPELVKLVDLRGKTLAVVETSGAETAFLEREVFEGELDPAAWFAALKPETDDFSAAASVLYGQTDAALVAEFNPLLGEHLGAELKVLFASPELSLPVLSVREAAFPAAAREALDRALEALDADPAGRRLLAGLGIDGLRPLAGAALAREPASRTKPLAIASAGGAVALDAPPPSPELPTFAVAVELPEIPLRLDEIEP